MRLWCKECHVLGHEVGKAALRSSNKHIESVHKLVEPVPGDEVLSFLGFVNFSFAFLDNFAKTAAPLYDVLKETGFTKKKKHDQRVAVPDWNMQWQIEQKIDRRKLNDAFISPAILSTPIRGLSKRAMTDNSEYGSGGSLLERSNGGKWV